ncbi:hypothetical protein MMC10_001935 [Thelotrema lepadinum]|nr:hypothetical protein [Thelotrema lepadinum]
MLLSQIAQTLLLLPAIAAALSIPHITSRDAEFSVLEKRRGGGGGGGGKGGGSSGGSSSSGSRGSGSSGSSGSSSSGSSSSGSSSSGGRGSTSSSPSFGGGRSYAGGSTSSYSAGTRSPSGISPFLLGGAALGFGAGALFLYGAYSYPYTHPYYYVDPQSHQNNSLPVDCFCDPYSPCGCDDTNNQTLINQMLQNSSVANITTVNNTKTVVIDGTLPNGTDTGSAGVSLRQTVMDASGYWVMASIVATMVWGI